jgi:hypothetical protein
MGKLPPGTTEDEVGNLWFKEEQQARRINRGVRGAHASIPFHCEDCWMVNLEGRLPTPELDDAYVMCIRRANLDNMGSRAISTIGSHAAAVKQAVASCSLIRKTPALPARRPMPMADELGMGKAVEMLFNSLTAKPCIKGQTHVQFDSVRQARATYTLLWESSPTGIREGSTFVSGALKVTRHFLSDTAEMV